LCIEYYNKGMSKERAGEAVDQGSIELKTAAELAMERTSGHAKEKEEIPDASEPVPELAKVLEPIVPIIASKKIRKRLDLESTLERLRDKVKDRDEEKTGQEKEQTSYKENLKGKGVDEDLKRVTHAAYGEIFLAQLDKKLSAAERAKTIKEALDKIPKPEKGDSEARKKQLERIREKIEAGEKLTDSDYRIDIEKPGRKIDLSPSSLVHKAVVSGAKRALEAMDNRMEEIEGTKHSNKTKERIKELELALRAPLIKAIGRAERSVGVGIEKKTKLEEELEERRATRADEFKPTGKKPSVEQTKIESLDEKVTDWLDDPTLNEQFDLLKDRSVFSIIAPEKKGVWKNFTNLFRQETADKNPTKRQIIVGKVKTLFNSVDGDTEKFILSGMTLKQFLRRTLK